MRTFGLIPAAGKSTRMGQPKLLLPLRGTSILEHVLRAVRVGGVDEVLVVVAPDHRELRSIAERAGAHVLHLKEDTADMRQTCQLGLDWLEARFQPLDGDGWLLLPADHPTTRPKVVRALLAEAAVHEDQSIFVPAFEGKRGHPVWLRWHLVEAIRAMPAEQGINVLIRDNLARTRELPWAGDEILRDLDTPEDYRRLLDQSELQWGIGNEEWGMKI